jgi:signal transduction histidine kinase
MTLPNRAQLEALGDFLASRREAILTEWRKAADADPGQTTVRSLTRSQFDDHIPEVLDAFELKLRSRPGGAVAQAADALKQQEEVKHGLHRWQQGYRLRELMHEWGHLQLCLLEQLEDFTLAHPECDHATLTEANRQMITLVNEAIGESNAQYERMQQAEAAGHVDDLMLALASVNEIERRRAVLIREAVHDLTSNVYGVTLAAKRLGESDLAGTERTEFATILEQGVHSVRAMLGELTVLARLEAGQERREIATFDAASLINEVCAVNRPLAGERGLFLIAAGPPRLRVEGDAGRVRRLLQNLLANALKYTGRGGVSVNWGEEKENWWLMVRDTGPGLLAGPGTPLLVGLKDATASARESDEKTAALKGETSQVLAPSQGGPDAKEPSPRQSGEGIGLSIVKRLCELLDASLEMASSPATGTTFRIVFPGHYRLATTAIAS